MGAGTVSAERPQDRAAPSPAPKGGEETWSGPSFSSARPNDHIWPRTRRLTAWLLVAWAVVAFVPVYFARELNFELFGWPLGYWIASQGALLVFLAIVAGYAWATARIEGDAAD